MLLTGVCTCKIRSATPDQFDLERALWTIPPEAVKQLQLEMRKKGKRTQDVPPYLVPLSIQALEICGIYWRRSVLHSVICSRIAAI